MPPSLLLLLRQAERRIELELQPVLGEYSLTLEHWRVLSALAIEPGRPMSALADAAVLPAASLTRYVDKLVERGLVLRRIHPADRRRAVTALTPAGEAAVERIREIERRAEVAALTAFQNAARPLQPLLG